MGSLDAIVRDVLLFARDFTINLQPLNTDELLDRTLEHCEAIITRSGVTVIRETHEVFDLQADQTLVTQALGNVLRNAVEAMTDSPSDCDDNELRLTVACRRVRCPDGRRRERIVFGVEDTGAAHMGSTPAWIALSATSDQRGLFCCQGLAPERWDLNNSAPRAGGERHGT